MFELFLGSSMKLRKDYMPYKYKRYSKLGSFFYKKFQVVLFLFATKKKPDNKQIFKRENVI